ncbi:MAG: hypothetical protein HY341_00770 [Candidatus Kerfeldbacteria bacterium]|nr:hypothetical protein [Candidatus Kerfeldbacteria bacterium]
MGERGDGYPRPDPDEGSESPAHDAGDSSDSSIPEDVGAAHDADGSGAQADTAPENAEDLSQQLAEVEKNVERAIDGLRHWLRTLGYGSNNDADRIHDQYVADMLLVGDNPRVRLERLKYWQKYCVDWYWRMSHPPEGQKPPDQFI